MPTSAPSGTINKNGASCAAIETAYASTSGQSWACAHRNAKFNLV